MYKARYYKQDGKKGRARQLPDALFDGVVNESVLHQAVKVYLANQRQGTAAARNRAAVAGGSRKPWRQKGTGRARQGSIRAPQWRGGGAVFGPVPRSYEHQLPKKARQAALRSALSLRAGEGALRVIDSFGLAEYRTRAMARILEALGLAGRSVLIVIEGRDPFVETSARNLPRVGVLRAEGLNVYDVLRHEVLLMTRAAVEAVEARLGDAGRRES